VIGRGLRLRSSFDYDNANLSEAQGNQIADQIEREFRIWAENAEECDAEGYSTFYELQSIAFLTTLISGEVFVILTQDKRKNGLYNLKVQLIEPDRVSSPFGVDNPNIIDGLEKDSLGRTVAIYVEEVANQNLPMATEWRRIPVYRPDGTRQVLHIMSDKERPGQVRGVPFLAPIMENLLRVEQYTNAELTAASINAMLTVFIKKQMLNDEEPFEVQDNGNFRLGNGAIFDLAPGEEVDVVDPKRPNVNFAAFVNAIDHHIGAALEVPGDEILLQYNASYSAARAIMLQAYKFYVTKRDSFSNHFCKPIYSAWPDEAASIGRLSLPQYTDIIMRKL
jgi:lambda family phage portal protein